MTNHNNASRYYPFIYVPTIVGCRISCTYCPQSAFTKAYAKLQARRRKMSFSDLVDYLRTVPPAIGIHFGGFSEAWLNPECTQMLLYAHSRGHRITVHTTLV